MPYTKKKLEGGQYAVYRADSDGKPTGKRLGTHDTETAAAAQIAALYASDEGQAMSEAAGDIPAPPERFIDALRRGIAQYEDGKGGDGLEDSTVAWARRMVAGDRPSADKIRQAVRWYGRNQRFEDYEADTPADVALNLWGGARGAGYWQRAAAALDATAREMFEEVAIVGEFRGAYPDVPLAPGVDLEALTANDPDPLFLTLPIAKPGMRSRNNLLYDEALVADIAQQINAKRPGGIMGHISEKDRSTAYPVPDVHWVGATRTPDGMLWAKAYVPPGTVREFVRRQKAVGGEIATSIYGHGTPVSEGDARRLENFVLESLDLAPPERAALQMARPFVLTAELAEEVPTPETNNEPKEITEMGKGKGGLMQYLRDRAGGDDEKLDKMVTELAATCEMDEGAFRKMASGERTRMPSNRFGKLAKALNMDADELRMMLDYEEDAMEAVQIDRAAVIAELTADEIPAALVTELIARHDATKAVEARIAEYAAQLDSYEQRVSELADERDAALAQIAEFARAQVAADIDTKLAEMVQIDALHPVIRRAIGTQDSVEAAETAIREYCETDEYKALADAMRIAEMGPPALVPGPDAKDVTARLTTIPTAELIADARSRMGF